MTIGVQQRHAPWSTEMVGPRQASVIRAYQVGVRTERCSCGGEISAPGNDWQAIAAAVAVHNRSTAHVEWAIEQGLRPRGERPTTARSGTDVAGAVRTQDQVEPGTFAAALAGGARGGR